MAVSGNITNINSENKMSKAGKPFKVYSIEVNGAWYEAGFKAPGNVGDFVTFDYSLSYGKNKITDGTLSKGSGASVGAAPFKAPGATSGPTSSGSGKTFPVPKNHPDRSIMRQNAVNRAVEVLTAGGCFDALDPSDENLDRVAAQVIGLAMRFEVYYSGETEAFVEIAKEGVTVV